MNYLKHVLISALSLIKGLLVTFRYLFKPAITVQYPWQKIVLSPRYRGFLEFNAKTCIACGMCVKACPVQCISLTTTKEANGKRVLAGYTINFSLCQFCRLCEESCPVASKSIKHGQKYEVCFTKREEMNIVMYQIPETT